MQETEESRAASEPLARANGRRGLPFPEVGRVGAAGEGEGQGRIQMGVLAGWGGYPSLTPKGEGRLEKLSALTRF